MNAAEIPSRYLRRRAAVYVRQSSPGQVANNLESQRRQYGLVDRATDLGWPRELVVVIDDDQGVSGAGGSTRAGFERLVADVGLGEIGIVLGLEASRLARNNGDWYRLLDLCGMVDTLIGDSDGVYHPGVFNDRLLLGLKGTMSEAELHLIRARLNGGLWEKARRGELRFHLPVGYEFDAAGKVVITADEAVRSTIELVFAKFAEFGSARAVTGYLFDENVKLPHRPSGQNRVIWRSASFPAVHRVLTNPVYAGIYSYGKSRQERIVDPSGAVTVKSRNLDVDEWQVFIEDHHRGYIAVDAWRANLARLRGNWRGAAVREGTALLQGLLRCGRCGRRMQVCYQTGAGRYPRYGCVQRMRFYGAGSECQSMGGQRLENAVVDAFLCALAPAGAEITAAAIADAEAVWTDEIAQRQLMVEQAAYQADRARRQFDRVEPENRLVARTLEQAWEAALAELHRRQGDLDRYKARRPAPLDADELAWLAYAGADLRAVWNAETTTIRERKQLLRCLIVDIVLTIDRQAGQARAEIIWNGAATTNLEVKLRRNGEVVTATDTAIVELVRRLAADQDDESIAFTLNAKRLRTGAGNTFTRRRVQSIRARHHIPAPRHQAVTARREDPTWMTVNQAAATLAVSPDTIQRWAREGFLPAQQTTPHSPWTVQVTDKTISQIAAAAPDGWVRLADAARQLGRSRQTILHWVQSGKLTAVMVTAGKRKGLRIDLSGQKLGLFADT